MRKLVFSFLAGCIIGTGITLALLLSSQEPSEEYFALEILDSVIAEWSEIRIDGEKLAVFGFPGARIGYISDTIYVLARRIDSLYHIPSGVVIAQWILESRFGLSDLGVNNTLGHTFAAVKSFMPQPRFVMRREKVMRNGVMVPGKPVAFASYASIAECFDTHGRYISQSVRYAKALAQKSSEAFAKELSRAGYAEDSEYALKLITIMRRYKLGS
jgi:hypothetical protein